MIVKLIQPQGYCAGVTNAIKLAYKAKEDNPDKNIYILGKLVHNQSVTDELTKAGIVTLECESEVETLNKLNKGDVIIFTAHGHDEKLDEIAKEKGLLIYDATCPKVKSNLIKIKKEIADNHQVIYIGQKGHKEAKAALSVSDKVSLYDTKLLINYQLITDNNPLVINQTTLNFLALKDIHNDILSHIENARIADEICDATRKRQEAILNIEKDTDLVIIVGASYSSNTQKLVELAKSHLKDATTVLVENVDEVKKLDLAKYKKAAISSGASTPNYIVQEIYNYLLSK